MAGLPRCGHRVTSKKAPEAERPVRELSGRIRREAGACA